MLRVVQLRNKEVPRPDQSDVVLAWNSTSTCSGTISKVNNINLWVVSEAVAKLNCVVVKPSVQLEGCPVHVETAFH